MAFFNNNGCGNDNNWIWVIIIIALIICLSDGNLLGSGNNCCRDNCDRDCDCDCGCDRDDRC